MDEANLDTFKLLQNTPDPTPELQAYSEVDIPYSWFDKLSAVASEALPETFNRNILTLQEKTAEGLDFLSTEFQDERLDEFDVKDSVIKTPTELNEKYKTDAFKIPMADFLAADYLANVQARQRNEYIIEHDGGTGIGTSLLGSLAGVIEPTNFVASFGMGAMVKGASIATKVLATTGEALGSTLLNAKAAKIGADVQYTGKDIAIGTAVGSVLGTGMHLIEAKFNPKNPTLREAKELANAAEGAKTPKESLVTKAKTVAPDNIKNPIVATMETVASSTGRLTEKEIVESFLPKLKPEATAKITAEINEAIQASTDDVMVVFNKTSDTLVEADGAFHNSAQFTTDINEGASHSFIDNNNVLEARFVPKDQVLNVDAIEPHSPALPQKLKSMFEALPSVDKAKVKTSDLLDAVLDPQEKARILKEFSDGNGGKAVLYKNVLNDFNGSTETSEPMMRSISDAELDPPKQNSEILKSMRHDTAFVSPDYKERVQANAELPDIEYEPKLTNINSKIAEVQEAIDLKVKSGFFDEGMLDFLERIKEEDMSFQNAEKAQQAYIFCSRGE